MREKEKKKKRKWNFFHRNSFSAVRGGGREEGERGEKCRLTISDEIFRADYFLDY